MTLEKSKHVGILEQGVAAWNQWRASNPDVAPDLGGTQYLVENANLDSIDLRGAHLLNTRFQGVRMGRADLREADLRRAELHACKLCRADLKSARLDGAIFCDSELTEADLTRASLCGVDLSSTEVTGATFREANLQGANLQVKRGVLSPEELAGADLAGARLPESLDKLFDDLTAVGEISESARKLFVTMLVACLYCWLTIATTTDLNLITNRASSPLPLVQTSIPIVGFYIVAPVLLLCVYFYFHFYLQKLWEELGSLPAIFPDGRRLHQRSDPWLLNDLVRSHVALLKSGRPFMSYFQQAISIVLAWWLVPITLFLFWGRYLSRHDLRWSSLQLVLLAISITAAIFLYQLAAATLRGRRRMSFRISVKNLTNLQTYIRAAVFVVTTVAFMLVTLGSISGVYPEYLLSWRQDSGGRWSWAPRAMALIGYSPFANLEHADVSIKPSSWTGRGESELDGVKGAELRGADLHYAEANGAFLAKANLAGAQLEHADLSRSDLRQARFIEFSMNAFWMSAANANLRGAYLKEADLRDAFLRCGILPDADLTEADLRGAFLNDADLTGTHLDKADLEFADFRSLDAGGFCKPTRGLTVEALKAAKNWTKAYYDDSLVKDLGCLPDHNAKVDEEKRREEQRRNQPAANAKGSAHDENPPLVVCKP